VGGNYSSVAAALVVRFSRGNLTITSTDANVAPVINQNFLVDERDIDVTLAAFKCVRNVWSSTNVTIGDEYLPKSNITADAEIADWIRDNAMMVWRASGTCKMGVPGDEIAVVDSKARVYGVGG